MLPAVSHRGEMRSFSLSADLLTNRFAIVQQKIKEQNFPSAIIQLMSLFNVDLSADEVIECYDYLFRLFPDFDSLDKLELNLPYLLDKSAHLHSQQESLALHLAKAYQLQGKQEEAMHYFAKALQINRSKANYRLASEHFAVLLKKRQDRFLPSTLRLTTTSMR